MVADGVGLAFTRECYTHVSWPGVVIKNIEGQPLSLHSAIVFGKQIRSTLLPAIIAALQVKKKQDTGACIPQESRRVTENSPLVQRRTETSIKGH